MKSFFSLILVVLASVVYGQGITFVAEDMAWKDILAKAKAENKIVFVDAYAVWCGPCKWMAKNIFPLKEVGDVYNAKFISAKIDMEKGEGPDLARKYNVRAYPTYIFVNGDGELVHKGLGSMPAPKFIEVGNAASDPNRQFYAQKKKFEAGNNSQEFLKNFSIACKESSETKLAEEVAAAYLKNEKNWLSEENIKYIGDFANNIEGDLYRFVVKNRAKFEDQLGKPMTEDLIHGNAVEALAAKFFNKTTGFEAEKAIAYANSINLPTQVTEKAIAFLKMYNFKNKRDVVGYLNATVAYYDKYPADDSNTLNSIAWTFYEQATEKGHLEKAISWSLKSIEMTPQYPFLDTAAALYFKVGNKAKAKEYAAKAIAKAKETGEDSAETVELLKQIEAMQ